MSTLFDIETEIPINYGLFKNNNERSALISQLEYVKANDILIMDKGYYSKELLFVLHTSNIKVIFRLKTNMKYLRHLKKDYEHVVDIRYKNTIIKFRLIQYYIGSPLFL